MTIFSTFKHDDISIIMAPITYNIHIKWIDLLLNIFNALRVFSVALGTKFTELKCLLIIC